MLLYSNHMFWSQEVHQKVLFTAAVAVITAADIAGVAGIAVTAVVAAACTADAAISISLKEPLADVADALSVTK